MSLDDNDAILKEHLHMSAGGGLDLSSYVKRYCDLAMRCLVADRFMESYRLSTIQCLILLIYSKNHSNDGGMSWALLGGFPLSLIFKKFPHHKPQTCDPECIILNVTPVLIGNHRLDRKSRGRLGMP